jgi:aspartyl/asparaginyl beta-hydroxylase (cupin superfamily)
MSENNIFILIIIIFILIIVLLLINLYVNTKQNKLFYETFEINKNLDNIDKYKNDVLEETINVYDTSSNWTIWPEKELYNNNEGWKVFPFYAFNVWIEDNCNKCPTIYKFLKQIKGLKLATLSKLSPNTKLNMHRGWGNYSNYVIRCHYGLVVPDNCYVHVEDENNKEERYHKKFQWLIFDDSKFHFAENSNHSNDSNHSDKSNNSDKSDRIVLIIDVERPTHIEIGNSTVGDTKELMEIFNYLKLKNKLVS